MGLLFVLEGDETGKELFVDINMETHEKIIDATKSSGPGLFPLVRRVNKYYSDVFYEQDEITLLLEELKILHQSKKLGCLSNLIELCQEAKNRIIGIEAIAD